MMPFLINSPILITIRVPKIMIVFALKILLFAGISIFTYDIE